MIYNLHHAVFLQSTKNIHTIQKKNNRNKNNKKTFPIKMKEDVGMSKPKKHANKVMWDPKLNKPLPYNTTALCILLYSGVSTYVGLYGSGLFNLIIGPRVVSWPKKLPI